VAAVVALDSVVCGGREREQRGFLPEFVAYRDNALCRHYELRTGAAEQALHIGKSAGTRHEDALAGLQ
jgi:hypothetical protein